jgi:hypothetical protein
MRLIDLKHSHCHAIHKETLHAESPSNSGKNAAHSVRSHVDHDRSSVADVIRTKSIDAVLLRNNCTLVAKVAREFKVPTILTTVAEKSFSGPIYEEIRSVFPKDEIIDRTTMNAWEDARVANGARFARGPLLPVLPE